MSYRVVYVRPTKELWFDGKNMLELSCRVEDNHVWQETRRFKVPFPIYEDDLRILLHDEFDVGNVSLQQHLEYWIPKRNPHW